MWEYERLLKIGEWPELKAKLNKVGRQGWEVCGEDQHKYLLKRPLQVLESSEGIDWNDLLRGTK